LVACQLNITKRQAKSFPRLSKSRARKHRIPQVLLRWITE
jgi:hypothetical protein